MVDVFVTKYALTKGIKRCEVSSRTDGFVYVLWPGSMSLQVRNNEAFDSFEAAAEKAYDMRDDRIISLKKQIAKLEKMKWSEPK